VAVAVAALTSRRLAAKNPPKSMSR